MVHLSKALTILALDTATEACSVALLVGEEVHEHFQIAPRRHSDLILEMVDSLLKRASLSLQAVDAIAFGSGPGSFMGVRIATGVAQGLAFGINRPVISVSTLQTIAQTAYEQTRAENILVGWDARMEQVYWGAYQWEAGLMTERISDRVDDPQAIKLPSDIAWLAVGNAWEVYGMALSEQLTSLLSVKSDIYPRAKAMLTIALAKYQRGEVLSAEKAEPTYVRNDVARTSSSK